MEIIAHRAGNLPSTIEAALTVADAVELDVHMFRGRLEVRHEKVFWPFSARWEKWYLVPAHTPRPELTDILGGLPTSTPLWLDLKGFGPRLTRRVLAATADFDRITVSSRSWWILRLARAHPEVRVMRSAGSRLQRWIAVRTTPAVRRVGNGVVLDERLADAATVTQLRRAGSVVAWGVRTRRRIDELAALGLDGVILDDLGLIGTSD
jgi:glycerophosphoryl diester phosphodiesterase